MPKPVTGGKEEEEEDDDDGCLDGRCSFPWRELTTTATGNCSSELYFASFSLFSAHSTCPIAIYHRIIVRFTYSFKVQHIERKHESSKHSEKRKTEKRRQQSSSVFHFDSTRVSLRQCLGECVLVTLKFALAAKREREKIGTGSTIGRQWVPRRQQWDTWDCSTATTLASTDAHSLNTNYWADKKIIIIQLRNLVQVIVWWCCCWCCCFSVFTLRQCWGAEWRERGATDLAARMANCSLQISLFWLRRLSCWYRRCFVHVKCNGKWRFRAA